MHESVGAGYCVGGKFIVTAAFSFGIGEGDSRKWFPFKRTWLGWSSITLPGYLQQGSIYQTDGFYNTVDSTKAVTPKQDLAWVNWMLNTRLNTKDVYSVLRHNCRTYSQSEFNDAPGIH